MKEAQKKRCFEILEQHAYAEAVYLNPRGHFFTDRSLAKNSLKKGEKLQGVTREEYESTLVKEVKNAKELIELTVDKIKEAVKTIKDKELLIEAIQLETQADNRSGAKEAIGNRIETLKTPE